MDGHRRTGKGERALVPDVEVRTYYDRPVLKQPTWKHWIPEYLFLGGLSAGSSLLALGATVTGRRTLARRAKVAAAGAIAAGTAALIVDLGRPARAANMLRVAKVTSPLNVGSWLLTFYAPAAGVAAAADVFGVLPGVGTAAQVGAAVLAPGVATYTAVVFADTSLPAWHGARRELPCLSRRARHVLRHARHRCGQCRSRTRGARRSIRRRRYRAADHRASGALAVSREI